jgi:hypothetical protein
MPKTKAKPDGSALVVEQFSTAQPKTGLMIQQLYVPVTWAYERLFEKNPKKHDIGKLCQSITRNGFRDPPAFDINLKSAVKGEQGAIAYGNGRVEALYLMERDSYKALQGLSSGEAPGVATVELVLCPDGRYRPDGKGERVPVPFIKGLAVGSDGEWLMPVVFGCDAVSRAQAEAFVVDHNNLTMAGGEFTALDMSRMYEMESYLELLEGLRMEDELPESVDADDLALMMEALAGAFDEGGGDDGDGEDSAPADDAAYQNRYGILIECEDAGEQERVYNEVQGYGYKCKVLTV